MPANAAFALAYHAVHTGRLKLLAIGGFWQWRAIRARPRDAQSHQRASHHLGFVGGGFAAAIANVTARTGKSVR
jgi:hypothetical protein